MIHWSSIRCFTVPVWCSTVPPSKVLLLYHDCSTISVPLLHHQLFYCCTITCSTVPPSIVLLFHHACSTLQPSEILLFHCSTVRCSSVHNQMFHYFTIRCSTVPPWGVLMFHHARFTVPPSHVRLHTSPRQEQYSKQGWFIKTEIHSWWHNRHLILKSWRIFKL